MSERRKRSTEKTGEQDLFVKGLMVFDPHEKAPEFVIGTLTINRDTLIDWLDDEKNDKFFKDDEKYGDTLTLSINESKEGKLYAVINTYGTDAHEEKEEPKKESGSSRRSRKK